MYVRWSLFFITNPLETPINQSYSHILGLKWGTSILCVIQDGGSNVDFFSGESQRRSKKAESLETSNLLPQNYLPRFDFRGEHKSGSRTVYPTVVW